MALPPLDVTAAWAGYWHGGQTDKAGVPYVAHLIRVQAHLLRLFPDASPAERHAAWLHDVLEDTPVTARDLTDLGYDAAVIGIVQSLTRPETGTYADWIDQLATGDLAAIRVKIADLTDNSDPTRLQALPAAKARSLEARYKAASERLWAALGQKPPWA